MSILRHLWKPKKSPQKQAFTLVEILIVLIVVAILIGVLFQVYSTIAGTSLRVRHQKEVGIKMVQMQTMIQNIVDTHVIDYTGFSSTPSGPQTSIYLHDLQGQPAVLSLSSDGKLFFATGGATTGVSLLGDDVILDNAAFLLMPTENPDMQNNFNNIHQPGIWLIGTLYPVAYTGVSFPVQTFFTLIQR